VGGSRQTYSAQEELSKPGSEAYLQRESAANKPIAEDVLGANVDLLGRPRPSLEALKRWSGFGEPDIVPADLTSEGQAALRPNEGTLPSQTIGEMSNGPEYTGNLLDLSHIPTSANRLLTSKDAFHSNFLRSLAASLGQ
jgi:hypothetical protein